MSRSRTYALSNLVKRECAKAFAAKAKMCRRLAKPSSLSLNI